ncbi:MAG: cytochrome c [Acidobacteria bacterium]|mgnify:CR=1 FL=1|jgi:S-disulfanyl-L-cysteine oxidoreductase SoxD|nr:cytochrome c [Acidobacteriota bacterium]
MRRRLLPDNAHGLWLLIWLAAITGLSSADAQAPVATRTTKAGVYTEAQASRGEQTYVANCVSCHPPSTYKGGVFTGWQGYSLADLLWFLQEKMPEDNPGSLSPKEYTQVIAYLLKINAMPAGRVDLPTASATLKAITIDILPGRPDPTFRPLTTSHSP